MTLRKEALKNILEKGENAGNQHFLLFLQRINLSLTLSQTINFRLFQTEFADDNFKFDENGRKLSEMIENTVWKEGIALYERFLLFPQCFQKTCTADT